ncbi:unnamed protein product [Pseudo-nitzschia multistriata]|uniref:Uncharacterized protein n=1 Tax=Pseudo-nitzschia multistriata TaxID=183589 RepID=A0A448ZDH7_9STRA|nr:unnamed protein product [Pseudo-nitzschia multistriata]
MNSMKSLSLEHLCNTSAISGSGTVSPPDSPVRSTSNSPEFIDLLLVTDELGRRFRAKDPDPPELDTRDTGSTPAALPVNRLLPLA